MLVRHALALGLVMHRCAMARILYTIAYELEPGLGAGGYGSGLSIKSGGIKIYPDSLNASILYLTTALYPNADVLGPGRFLFLHDICTLSPYNRTWLYARLPYHHPRPHIAPHTNRHGSAWSRVAWMASALSYACRPLCNYRHRLADSSPCTVAHVALAQPFLPLAPFGGFSGAGERSSFRASGVAGDTNSRAIASSVRSDAVHESRERSGRK